MSQSTANAPFFVDNETIRLTKNGIWLSDDVEIDHEQTRRMFAHGLERAEDGKSWRVRVGRETKTILVEDTPYFVIGIDGSPTTGYELRLNDESREWLDASTLTYRPGRLACKVRRGEKHEEAKFLHAPYFELLKELEEDQAGYWLEIGSKRILLLAK